MSFVHLHARSNYSWKDGAMSPADLAKAAKRCGMSHVAMTDRSNLAGVVAFVKACEKEKVLPVIGAEIWMLPEHMTAEQVETACKKKRPKKGKKNDEVAQEKQGYRILLLAKDARGYENLCVLLSRAMRRIFFVPRTTKEDLREVHEGLFCLVGTKHGPSRLMNEQSHFDAIEFLRGVFHEDLFIELTNTGPDDQVRMERERILAGRMGIACIATNEVLFEVPEDCAVIDAMHAIATGEDVFGTGPSLLDTDQAWFKSEADMQDLGFSQEELDRSGTLANQCTFKLERGKVYLPVLTPPENLPTEESKWAWLTERLPPPRAFLGKKWGEVETEWSAKNGEKWSIQDRYFADYARKGLTIRLEENKDKLAAPVERYHELLEFELSVIIRMGFPTYLLIVAEYVNWSKDNDVPVGPGRGSAAGSVVVWALRVTDLDPIRYGLMFERFLNPDRVSMPDIDVDFGQAGRELVIHHVQERYGHDRVGQILTVGRFKAKQAIQDVARICGVGFDERTRWSKAFDDVDTLTKGLDQNAKLKNRYDHDPLFRTIFEIAVKLEGKPRQTGFHAAGIVIANRPLETFAPLHTDLETGRTYTGIDMVGAEDIGLVKFDFLGLKTLDVLKETAELIKARTGQDFNFDKTPVDEPRIYETLSRGDTLGLFQVESHGMSELTKRLKPGSMDDVSALLALYRPGPLESGMVEMFVECKHGRMPVAYSHPLLEPVLKKTYGVIVYQEQVMLSAQVLAGFSLAEADLLRRAMGKKKKEEMEKQKARFVEGCKKNQIDERHASDIFELIDHFAGYGFNLAHSAAYALITVMTTWAKIVGRPELMAACLSWEKDQKEREPFVFDCRRNQIPVLAPDINQSGARFGTLEYSGAIAVRCGIGSVKKIGPAVYEALLNERDKNGPFLDLDDFIKRKPPKVNKAAVENLAMAGAFDSIGAKRHEVVARVQPKPKKKKVIEAKARDLNEAQDVKKKVKSTPWTHSDRLDYERNVLGVWISGHPFDRYPDLETIVPTTTIEKMVTLPRRTPVTLLAVTGTLHRVRGRDGRYINFLTLLDRTGVHEGFLFHEAFERQKDQVERDRIVVVRGVMDGSKLKIDRIEAADKVRQRAAKEIHVTIEEGQVERIDDLLLAMGKSPGKVPVFLVARDGSHALGRVKTDLFCKPEPELFMAVEEWSGKPDHARVLLRE